MEVSDSSRSPLGIDLNEIPSTSSADTQQPDLCLCGGCGRPEAEGDVVVCDACERGFHLDCAGMCWQPNHLLEWVCANCVKNGAKSKLWPLGRKKRILDINASPPRDVDGDATDDVLNFRKHSPGDNSFGGNAFVAPVAYSRILHERNGFGYQKASGIVTNTGKTGLEFHTQSTDRSFQEVELRFPLGKLNSSFNPAIRFPSQNPSEILLQALREFVSERHGVLEEGWSVELRHSTNSYELYTVYCAPDGSTFDSMSEVACYLGLMSNYNSVDTKVKTEESRLHDRVCVSKKQNPIKFPIANGFAENKCLISFSGNGFSSNSQHMGNFTSTSNSAIEVTESGKGENCCSGFLQNNEGLPIQFEDLFILSLGCVDVRPMYHNASLIYPVGFTSSWHDKITGSLFICEVLDGDDSGPIFKVTRSSCSALPIPEGSTILVRPNFVQCSAQHNDANGDITSYGKDYDNDVNIQTILSDPSPPVENDIYTCLGNSSDETCDDEIGEISVEDCSSSSAWKRMSQKFVDCCSEICKQKGVLKLSCKHIENSRELANWDMMDEKEKKRITSLTKFCGSSLSISIPFKFSGDNADVLLKWLDEDRFGLDAEFVQEVIERLPGVKGCSLYEFLMDRNCSSAFLTVGNGSLMAKMKGGVGDTDRGLDGSFGRSKKPRLVEDHDHCPPPGKALCSRLPLQIVGIFYQVWEFLRRFHEVLGLKESFSLEELEDELINPWIDSSSPEEREKKIQGTDPLSLHQSDVVGGQTLSNESHQAVSRENPHAFIQLDTGVANEAAQAGMPFFTYSRCFGVVLTKAHSSMLEVLIAELQSKVSALVNPNSDSGESKPRRGRKKDADSSIPHKRGKLNMLPINELTWPEVARRYVLAFLSMDGILDSPEVTARESGRVFRCLQGDGGVLCGSLTGVSGMEADAQLLAEATKKIFGSLNRENDVLIIEDEVSDASGNCEKNIASDGTLPEWATVLEPVKKLPTNVGTRIRKCVYDALERDPPDWAKKRLEHSISKEVYKGNASGPTKKAVLSVLADVRERLPQNSEKGCKRKTVISISSIIMNQCHIVLRQAAVADDARVFCNLLGRKPLSSTDNDDDGFLGSPAMVSRPLDFRTIDLRLAVGAYDGSHDAFLEDVRELWNNVRSAFGDQPDFVDLAEKLSRNFESLYENEVVTLVQKLVGYAKLESLSKEMKKEINDILVQTSVIPKAPWDEGVCKVCGVDKDDDSVLLCDTCDAEYHTYCLDPPLARIPEGNWYCPSCVIGSQMVHDASERSQVGGRHKGKNYQGEITHLYLEALRQLTTIMEEKEYWQFNVHERTFLLKFLCDELLNSALLRKHLEQCAEATAELQQKLRSFSLEFKNLKSREETVAARAAKVEVNMTNSVGEVCVKEGPATAIRNNGKQSSNSRIVFSDDAPTRELGLEEPGLMNPTDTGDQIEDPHGDNSKIASQKIDKPFRPDEHPLANSLPQEIDNSSGDIHSQNNLQELSRDTASPSPPSNNQELCVPSEVMSLHAADDTCSVAMNEPQAYNLELNNIKNDMLLVQESIATLEKQLLKLSVRREFLGFDSGSRLYWVSAMPGMHPRIIVDGSSTLQQKRKTLDSQVPVDNDLVLQNASSSGSDACSNSEGSKASCPFQYDPKVAMAISSQWVFYQTDAEIGELINWLRDGDPKERELKESILNWKKSRLQDSQHTKKRTWDDFQSALSTPTNSDKAAFSDCLVTKAAALLEKKYGPCFVSETSEILKGGKWARVTSQKKMYHCKCLEPIWPSRNHCISCHRTFAADVEFEEHNEKCKSTPLSYEKSKEASNSLKGKGSMKSDMPSAACSADVDLVTEMPSRLIKFQNEGCPFDLNEISSKFMTHDSNKELVQEIGLLSSKGIPSLIPSVSPFLSDSTLMSISPQKEVSIPDGQLKAAEMLLSSQGKQGVTNAGNDSMVGDTSRKSAADGIHEVVKSKKPALGCSEQRDRKSSLHCHIPKAGVKHCCVIPRSSLRPLIGRMSQIKRRLKVNLLDIDAALPEEALRPSKAQLERRWAWRGFVKSAETIYEMVQATFILEDMIKTEFLRNEWWYWSSLSAAAQTPTMSSLALRVYSLDAAIIYNKSLTNLNPVDNLKLDSIPAHKPLPSMELAEKSRVSRKSNRKRKEPDG